MSFTVTNPGLAKVNALTTGALAEILGPITNAVNVGTPYSVRTTVTYSGSDPTQYYGYFVACPIRGAQDSDCRGLASSGVIQEKDRAIPLIADVTPKRRGTVTFTLTRVTPKGKWIIGKVKVAKVNAKGQARSRWILEGTKPSGPYTVVASFRPATSGVPGLTVTQAITVQ